jgi:hypothetical protein
MTVSRQDLQTNMAQSLKLIGEFCTTAPIGELHQKEQAEFESILPTTWQALNDLGHIRLLNTWHFQITPSGWIEALKATGVLCNEQMKKDLGSLCGALKNRLNGRHEPALVGTDEIVSTTGLPRYWIVNVIHSHLVKYCLKKIDADWADGDAMRCR